MSFSEALTYPFKSQNIPKVLTIILVFLLIVAVVVVGGLMMDAAGIILLAIPIIIVYSVFVGGYTIEVIRSVMSGETIMPQPQLGRDIKRGIVTVIASIVHFIPLFAFLFCAMFIFGSSLADSIRIDAYGNVDSSGLQDSIGLVCGLGIVSIIFGFLLNFTLTVGMARYAAEDRAGAMFDIGSNFSTVLSNMGSVFGLLIRSFGIGILYYIIMNVVDYLFRGSVGEAFNPNAAEPGITVMLLLTVYGILYLSLGLMNQLSGSHLIAGFAQDVGISTRKSKHDDFDFD